MVPFCCVTPSCRMQALHVAFDADSKDAVVIVNDGVLGVPFVCKDYGTIDELLRQL